MIKIKGIAFDLDGVITDTAKFHFIAWQKLAESIDIKIDEKFNERLKGVSREESLRLILEYGNRINDFSKNEVDQLLFAKNEHYKLLIKNLTSEDILPGIYDFIKDAKTRGIPMVIASASKNAPDILNYLEIRNFFDYIINPSSLEHNKPAPDIFLKAAEVLNLNPREMIGIEDAEAGIKAINSARMFSVGIGDFSSLKESHLYLPSTSHLDLELLNDVFKEFNE